MDSSDESPIRATGVTFRNSVLSPLGGILFCGFVRESGGLKALRVFGKYALVYVAYGEGRYLDSRGSRPVRAGDLITVFPDVGQGYGPVPGGRWDEFYIVFSGPVFDLWRSNGLLNPVQPIKHLEPTGFWLNRIVSITGAGNGGDPAKAFDEVVRMQGLLAEIITHGGEREAAERVWLDAAMAAMARFPDDRQAAKSLGVSYETFRKRFGRLAGRSPGHHRASQAMDEACRLLKEGSLGLRAVADRVGCCDEFHFSRRFKKIVGVSPSQFRKWL